MSVINYIKESVQMIIQVPFYTHTSASMINFKQGRCLGELRPCVPITVKCLEPDSSLEEQFLECLSLHFEYFFMNLINKLIVLI